MTLRPGSTALVLSLLLAPLAGCLRASESSNQYVGAGKCKLCHLSESKGSPYGNWLKQAHRKAYDDLASHDAQKIARQRNIADPQKDEACLSCHVTAAGVPAEMKGKKFDQTQGVQCESCHGPGGNHARTRMEEEEVEGGKVVPIPSGEIIAVTPTATCLQCHNDKSPTYKPFDYAKFLKQIAHLDPRRNHPPDYLDRLGAEGGAKAGEKK